MSSFQNSPTADTDRRFRKPIPAALRLILGLATTVVLGTLVFMLPIASTSEPLAANQAFFTAVSALTVAGLSIISVGTDLSLFGQIVLLVLIQIGGVGFMVAAAVTLRLLGRKLSLIDRLTLTDSLGLTSPQAILKVTRQMLQAVFLFEGIGALTLFVHWRNDPSLTQSQAFFYAIFHSISAFCNAGFDLFSGTPGYEGLPNDNLSLVIIGSLVLIGGIGIPVLYDFVNWPWLRKFSLHTRLTLLVVIFLTSVGTVGFFLAESRSNGSLANEPLSRQLLISLFQSISARTAGFAGIDTFSNMTPASQLLLTALMFIGCPPASMGGGITTGTFAVLALSLWGFARGLPNPVFAGRTVASGMVRKATAVLTISIFVVGLATWLILMTHDAPVEMVLFEVVSAFATCGLTLGFTTELNLFGQLIICIVMFWGRLGALTIVIALGRMQGQPQAVNYPEEQILIG